MAQLIDDEVRQIVRVVEALDVDISNERTESNSTLLALVFDVTIGIRSPVPDYELDRFLEGPFDSAAEKAAFTRFLKNSQCPEFEKVAGVDNLVYPSATQPRSSSRSTASIGLIVGLALATLAIVLLVAMFVYIRIRSNHPVGREQLNDDVPLVFQSTPPDERMQTEFEAGTNNEISTLGDPFLGAPLAPGTDGSTIGSSSLEYDFKKAYQDNGSLAGSDVEGSTAEGSPIPTVSAPDAALAGILPPPEHDDGSAYDSVLASEETFEVVAPAGMLGLILETDVVDNRPVVNNIRPTSVLAHVVKIGDHLITVDGEHVARQKASDVSALIASKKNEQARVLVFARSIRATRTIEEEDE